jgi:hypothetical protein
MLYDAHYDPSYNKKMMCFIDTLDNDDIDDYIKIDMTLKTFIRYLAGLLQRKRASITLLRQYWKIIGAKCKLTPKTKHGAINIY